MIEHQDTVDQEGRPEDATENADRNFCQEYAYVYIDIYRQYFSYYVLNFKGNLDKIIQDVN